MEPYVTWTLSLGGAALAGGLALLAWARRKDRENYVVEKATPMPVALVSDRDDAWVRGEPRCPSPVVPPHFGTPCLHYEYLLEERVMRTRTGPKGRVSVHHEWVTRDRRSDTALFEIAEGDAAIGIDVSRARFTDMRKAVERMGSFRHTLRYLAAGDEVSAVGSVSEGRALMEPFGEVPLIVTPLTRDEYVRAAERAETIMRFFGFVLVFLGGMAVSYGLFDHVSWPAATGGEFSPRTLAAAFLAGLTLHAAVWAVYVYNTFVTYGVRVENAWRQVDVDLKMRSSLVPDLVSAVRGALAQEKDVLEHLTALRGEALRHEGDRARRLRAEGEVSSSVARLVAVVEKTPRLSTQPVVAKLMDQLTAAEERLAHGRRVYNEAVQEYNANVLALPRGLLARACGFGPKGFFAAGREAPR